MDIIFWAVAIVSGLLSLTRLPKLSRSRNQSIFISGFCVCFAFTLMIPLVYETVDALFTRTNFTDLFAKLSLLLAVNILVGEIARTLNSAKVRHLTAGLAGKIILILAFGLEMLLFAFIDTPKASPGLGAYINDPLVLAYNDVTVLYIGFLGAIIIAPLIRDVRTESLPARRLASALIAAGLVVAILRGLLLFAGFVVNGMYEVGQIMSGVSALFVVAGLATAWYVLRKHGTDEISQSHLRID